jgi:hypothetical protein
MYSRRQQNLIGRTSAREGVPRRRLLQSHVVREMHDPAPYSLTHKISWSTPISCDVREHFIREQLP